MAADEVVVAAVSGSDPGPIARFLVVTGDPTTPEVIVQRLSAGESLRELARAWGLPYTRFLAWIAANGELSERCKRVRELAGVELRMEGLEIVDEIEGELDAATVAAAKLRSDYRERLSRDLNRPLFGKQVQVKHEHTFDLGDQLRRAMQRERVVVEMPPAGNEHEAEVLLSASGGATSTDGIGALEPALPRQGTTSESRRPTHEHESHEEI